MERQRERYQRAGAAASEAWPDEDACWLALRRHASSFISADLDEYATDSDPEMVNFLRFRLDEELGDCGLHL